MNTLAFVMEAPNGLWHAYALYGDTALCAVFNQSHQNHVMQVASLVGLDAARQWLVDEVAHQENRGWRLLDGDVKFDLSDVATAEINGTLLGSWRWSPRLHEELVAAVKPIVNPAMPTVSFAPPSDPKVGDIWIEAGSPSVWAGANWSRLK